MHVGEETEFYQILQQAVAQCRPLNMIETGTYLGMGTTSALCLGLSRIPQVKCNFYSIEISPVFYSAALQNLRQKNLLQYVHILNGLSVPRNMLPTKEAIQKTTVDDCIRSGIYADFPENMRAEVYHSETARQDCPEDLLGLCLAACDFRPDILLLDSAGHMGFIEFQYALSKIQGQCLFILDDTRHVKHHNSLHFMSNDKRFQILNNSHERFGFCIARYTPEV
jgi:hypothetical protein